MRNRKLYPKDWRARARAAKERANWKCERCGVGHGVKRLSWAGNWWPVWLQAHHPDHDKDNPDARLMALCPRCHWRLSEKRPSWFIELLKHRQRLKGR